MSSLLNEIRIQDAAVEPPFFFPFSFLRDACLVPSAIREEERIRPEGCNVTDTLDLRLFLLLFFLFFPSSLSRPSSPILFSTGTESTKDFLPFGKMEAIRVDTSSAFCFLSSFFFLFFFFFPASSWSRVEAFFPYEE